MIRVVRTAAAAALAALAIVLAGAAPATVTSGLGTAVSITCHLDGSVQAGDAVMVCGSETP